MCDLANLSTAGAARTFQGMVLTRHKRSENSKRYTYKLCFDGGCPPVDGLCLLWDLMEEPGMVVMYDSLAYSRGSIATKTNLLNEAFADFGVNVCIATFRCRGLVLCKFER